MIRNLKHNKAFTIIELIVVIAIIGILVLLAAPKLLGYTDNAKMAQIQNDVLAYKDAITAEVIKSEAKGIDIIEEWGWDSIETGTLQSYVDNGSLINEKGPTDDLEDGDYFKVNKEDVSVKSSLKGDFYYSKDGGTYYHDGSKDEGTSEPESEEIPDGFTLLTDDDFFFFENRQAPNEYKIKQLIEEGVYGEEVLRGFFQYVGSATKVVIPHEIMGNEVKDYYGMFSGNGQEPQQFYGAPVTAAISTNSNITDMSEMFSYSQAESLDLSRLNTSGVTLMFEMFRESQATKLDLSNWNTSNVTDMEFMFYGSSADILDLSSFDTNNVESMDYIFGAIKAEKGYARTEEDLNRFNDSETEAPLDFNLKLKKVD